MKKLMDEATFTLVKYKRNNFFDLNLSGKTENSSIQTLKCNDVFYPNRWLILESNNPNIPSDHIYSALSVNNFSKNYSLQILKYLYNFISEYQIW